MYQYLLTGAALGICSVTDLRHRTVDRRVVAAYILLAAAGHLASGTEHPVQAAAGLLPGAFCFLLSWATRQGLGYGDSALILACGASLGFWPCVQLAFWAFLLAGLFSLTCFVLRRADRKKEIPFVPFLFLGLILLAAGG